MKKKRMFLWTIIGLLMMFLAILLSGCRSSKQSMQTDIERTLTKQQERNVEITQQAFLDIYRHVSQHRKTKLDFVLYDTEKPPDESGNYPKIAEGQLSSESNIQADTSVYMVDTTNAQITERSAAKLKESDNSMVIKVTDGSTGIKQWKWIVWGVVVLIVVGFGLWCRLKRIDLL